MKRNFTELVQSSSTFELGVTTPPIDSPAIKKQRNETANADNSVDILQYSLQLIADEEEEAYDTEYEKVFYSNIFFAPTHFL